MAGQHRGQIASKILHVLVHVPQEDLLVLILECKCEALWGKYPMTLARLSLQKDSPPYSSGMPVMQSAMSSYCLSAAICLLACRSSRTWPLSCPNSSQLQKPVL